MNDELKPKSRFLGLPFSSGESTSFRLGRPRNDTFKEKPQVSRPKASGRPELQRIAKPRAGKMPALRRVATHTLKPGATKSRAACDQSEQELERELELPRGVGSRRYDPCGGAVVAAGKSHRVRRRKVCAIQHVESFRAKLHSILLRNIEVFGESGVKVVEPGPNESSASHISERACSGQQESIAIEVMAC